MTDDDFGKRLVEALEAIPKEDRDSIADSAEREYINDRRKPDESYEQARERLWEVFHAGERLKQEQEKAR